MAATAPPVARPAGAPPAAGAAQPGAQPFVSASLYVGDLHPEVTEVMLLEVFNEVGPVASIRVCRDAVTRRSLGYAYVNFHNFVDAERALEIKNFFPVKGKAIRIMWSHRDPAIRKSGDGNIFIKNLDKRIDNKALFDTFSDYGNILSCKVAVDSQGESKGYGFIHFENTEAADNAIERVNGKSILDRVVYVGHFRSKGERVAELGERANRFTNVYVKNLDKATNEDQLRDFASKFGEVTSLTIMKDDASGESRGFGFINFSSPEQAANAVEGMNGQKIGDSEQEIFAGRAQKKEERQQELKNKFDALRQERQQKYQGVNLFVKNLDEEIDDEALRKEFSAFGTITSAKVMTEKKQMPNPEGGTVEKEVSKGFGFVCFSTPEEATKAVTELNGRMIGAKPIYVALAQRKDARRAQLEAQMAQRQAQTMRHMQRLDMPPGAPPGMYPPGMMYPQGMPMPGHPRQVMYPQQMMQRAGWRPGGPRPPYPVQPGMMGNPNMQGMKPQRQARGPNQARGPQQGGPQQGGPGGPRGPKGPRGPMQGQMGGPMPAGMMPAGMQMGMQPMPMQMQQQMPPPAEAGLTAASLAAAPQHQQKQMLGERLYPLIHAAQPELAGKITGMLLEMDNSELLLLLDSQDQLSEKIAEAIKVLDEHDQQAAA
eukprot:COSAG05_NODE_1777_length_4100_cov_290.731317_2_plen_656_part_00